jgi:CheY-like chemotaxis protein
MPDARVKFLIVDDEFSIRTSLSQLFSALGYCVRSAADGRTALSEIRREIPEILLSDLNMPGMSGFEFLPMVRIQLPAIHVIAMSGAFSGTCVPPGVVADAFFAKNSEPALLIKTVEAMTQPECTLSRQPSMEYPTRISTARAVPLPSVAAEPL